MTNGLDPDLIKRLLSAKPKQKRGRGGKKVVDTSIREIQTWFKLSPQAFDAGNMESYHCSNPDCLDDRKPILTSSGVEVKMHFTVEIKGQRICRRCFLAGWLLEDPAQLKL